MRLGISYLAYEGTELLPYAVRAVRPVVDFVSVVVHRTSYAGDPPPPSLDADLAAVAGLADAVVDHPFDPRTHRKAVEAEARNLGVTLSREAGCTHHISTDVDEFHAPEDLIRARSVLSAEPFDASVVPLDNYYRFPTAVIRPHQRHRATFVHPVTNWYDVASEFPFPVDRARKLARFDKVRVFTRDEVLVHHMSFVRRDIRPKLANSLNWAGRDVEEAVAAFRAYRAGDPLRVGPDFCRRKTATVGNRFGIPVWG